MGNLTLEHLKELAQHTANPSMSMFLQTHRSGQDIQQDPIRFKNLLRDAEKQLLANGMGPREVSELLEPAEALVNDSSFWKYQYEGLAVFLSPEGFYTYRLPFSVKELLVIAHSYYIKPVLPLFSNNGHYYILAISQNEIRLFECTHHTVGQIDLPEKTPHNLEEALKFDDLQKELQFHTGTSQGGMRNGMFHGQGPGEEEQKIWIEKYLNLVDNGIKGILGQQEAPLVLAGVDYLLPIYRKVSEYSNIMQEGITGSPEHFRPEELLEQSWPIVEAYFHQETEKAVAQFHQLANTNQATDEIEKIVTAAFFGRVDKLFLSIGAQVWGSINSENGKVINKSEMQNKQNNLALLDYAAIKTLQTGGTVYTFEQEEMPSDSSIAAIFRY